MSEERSSRARWDERMDAMFRGGRAAVLVASAGDDGLPHLATAERIQAGGNGLVEVSGWLCPRTIHNLKENPVLVLLVRAGDDGAQVEASVQRIEEDAILDGYVDAPDAPRAPPQVRWILHVRPGRILDFGERLHSDDPLED